MCILPREKRDWQWLYSWGIITIFEPRLLDLERVLLDAMTLPPEELIAVFRRIRHRVAELVGWSSGRRHPALRSSDAYHIAMSHLIAIAGRREVVR